MSSSSLSDSVGCQDLASAGASGDHVWALSQAFLCTRCSSGPTARGRSPTGSPYLEGSRPILGSELVHRQISHLFFSYIGRGPPPVQGLVFLPYLHSLGALNHLGANLGAILTCHTSPCDVLYFDLWFPELVGRLSAVSLSTYQGINGVTHCLHHGGAISKHKSMGNRGFQPNINIWGLTPATSLRVALYVCTKNAIC